MRPLVLSALAMSGALVFATPAAAEFDAAGYYQMRCSGCHGPAGQGTRHQLPSLGPALKGNPFVVNGSAAAIRTVVRKGRQGERRLYNDTYPNMPSFGPEAVPDVDALVAYIKGPLQK
jgi:mono/diheme cytochrome c family protein